MLPDTMPAAAVREVPEHADVNPLGCRTSACLGCQLFDAWAVAGSDLPWVGRQRNRHREWGECTDMTRGGTFRDPEDGGERAA